MIDFLLLTYLTIIVCGIYFGIGESRKVVVFNDFNDLGLTFLIPVSLFLLYMATALIDVSHVIWKIVSAVVVIVLSVKLAYNTYMHNNKNILKAIVAFLTKIPLAFVWIINVMTYVSPGGKTEIERANKRDSAGLVLLLLTPIVVLLVANKNGSLLNPVNWFEKK